MYFQSCKFFICRIDTKPHSISSYGDMTFHNYFRANQREIEQVFNFLQHYIQTTIGLGLLFAHFYTSTKIQQQSTTTLVQGCLMTLCVSLKLSKAFLNHFTFTLQWRTNGCGWTKDNLFGCTIHHEEHLVTSCVIALMFVLLLKLIVLSWQFVVVEFILYIIKIGRRSIRF